MDGQLASQLEELELRLEATELALGLALRMIGELHPGRVEAAVEAMSKWIAEQPPPTTSGDVWFQRIVGRALERLGAADTPFEEQLPS